MVGELKTDSALARQLRERIKQDKSHSGGTDTPSNISDRLLFMGNWHDAFPRGLILDPLLQSTDKCVYLLLRTYLTATGSTRMPSYDEIGALLSLSRGTIARSLHILRAARWVTLCNALRDESTGRFKGNTYAIHDEVLSIQEAMVLDGRYIEALEEMEKNHKHHRVRMVAYAVLENVRNELHQEEPDHPLGYQDGHVISRFLAGGLENNKSARVQNLGTDNHRVQILNSDDENEENHSLSNQVQKLDSEDKNLDSVNDDCSSSYINNINIKTTTTKNPNKKQTCTGKSSRHAMDPNLIWPSSLSGDARWVAWQALQKCPTEYHQDLLDELAARLLPSSKNPIKNPSAWLAWAAKELRNDGIYPITNLSINHRRLREREQQQKKVGAGNPSSVNIRAANLIQTNRDNALQHVAVLKTALTKSIESN